MIEKRTHPRAPVLLEVLWESDSGKYESRTSDLSLGGCFIQTSGQLAVGEMITFKLRLLTGEWIELHGVVKHERPRIGFGVKFEGLSEETQKQLAALVNAER